MNITIYTTSSDKWYRTRAKRVEKAYAPVFPITFTFVTIEPPEPVFRTDKDGDKCFNWDWFGKTFPKVDGGVAFHFNKKYAKKWGIKLGGQRDSVHTDAPYFWLTADKEDKKGYKISNFERLLYHEIAHYWEDLDNDYGNKLVQDSVHHTDYDLKKIHEYHLGVDFSLYNKKQVSFLQAQIDKLKAMLPSSSFVKGNFSITQAFGVPNPIYKVTGIHIGVDLGCPNGTPLYAPYNGTLISGYGKDTGNYIIFNTQKGNYRFCHLSQMAVPGEYKQGVQIGATGNTGALTTGFHLHAEKWVTPVDVSKLTRSNVFNHVVNPI